MFITKNSKVHQGKAFLFLETEVKGFANPCLLSVKPNATIQGNTK
jgi:hypothetical protein